MKSSYCYVLEHSDFPKLKMKFSIQKFHDEVLISGCLPIEVFEKKMNAWIEEQKSTAQK